MNTLTKRLMESTVLVAIIISFVFVWNEKRHAERFRNNTKEFAQIFKKAMWEQYGPGSKEAYFKAGLGNTYHSSSSSITYTQSPSSNPWNVVVQQADLLGNPFGFVKPIGFVDVPESPNWFSESLQQARDKVGVLEKALDSGLFLAAPNEPYFKDSEYHMLNMMTVQNAARTLGYLAMDEWQQGDHTQAIERMTDIVRLGNALRAGPYLIEQLIRLSILSKALDGFEFLIWNDPENVDNRRILNVLNELEPQKWHLPPYMKSFPYLAFENRGYNPTYPPQQLAALLLFENARQRNDSQESQSDIQKANVLPEKRLTIAEVTSLLNKWTTVPALRKRAEQAAPAIYQSNPLLSSEEMQIIPPLFYLASESIYFYRSNVDDRLTKLKMKAQVLSAAYWVRVWREEHQRWPSRGEFRESCPFAENLNWDRGDDTTSQHIVFVETENQQSFVTHLFRNHLPPGQYHYSTQVKEPYYVRSANTVYYPLPWPDSLYFEHQYGLGVNPTRREMVDWMMGILESFQPFVQSVTVSYSITKPFELFTDPQYEQELISYYSPGQLDQEQVQKDLETIAEVQDDGSKVIRFAQELAVRLNPPKKSYWLTLHDPDLIHEESGDYFQLVGWEY